MNPDRTIKDQNEVRKTEKASKITKCNNPNSNSKSEKKNCKEQNHSKKEVKTSEMDEEKNYK